MKTSDVRDWDFSALRKYPIKIKDLTECRFAAKADCDVKCSDCGKIIPEGTRFWYSRYAREFNTYRNDCTCQKCCHKVELMNLEDVGIIWLGEALESEITFCR